MINEIKKGVSVIICCYNSSSRLSATLNYAKNQKCGGINWEIILVDNASTDDTATEARRILTMPPITDYSIVSEPEPGLSHAKRRGYLSAKYEYLLFCDDDNWLQDDYVAIGFNLMENHPDTAVIGGLSEAVFETEEPEWFKKYAYHFAIGEQSSSPEPLSQVGAVYGAGTIIRKSYLDKLFSLGFQSILTGRKGTQIISGEDKELCYLTKPMGYKVKYYRGLRFKHLMTSARMNQDYLKRLFYGNGRTGVYLIIYHYCIDNRAIPGQQLKYPYWLDRWLYDLKRYLIELSKYYSKSEEERLKSELSMLFLKGEMEELYRLKGDYVKIAQKILDFVNKITPS
jgi:glycosyltransferase involved in cell wall biosynthesis